MLGMIALSEDAAEAVSAVVSALLSDEVSVDAASDCVSEEASDWVSLAASEVVSVESDWVVSAFRNGMVQPPGMYTPVTAVTPRKQISSSTAIKETTLFFNESASLNGLFVTE